MVGPDYSDARCLVDTRPGMLKQLNKKIVVYMLFGMLDPSHDTHAHPGGPAKIWSDYVWEHLSYSKMAFHRYRVVRHRVNWRKSIQKVMEHT